MHAFYDHACPPCWCPKEGARPSVERRRGIQRNLQIPVCCDVILPAGIRRSRPEFFLLDPTGVTKIGPERRNSFWCPTSTTGSQPFRANCTTRGWRHLCLDMLNFLSYSICYLFSIQSFSFKLWDRTDQYSPCWTFHHFNETLRFIDTAASF